MRICESCQKLGSELVNQLAFKERVFLLASVGSMMTFLEANADAPGEDRLVASSVATKLLLSFPSHQREAMLNALNLSTNLRVMLGSCPHAQAIELVQ